MRLVNKFYGILRYAAKSSRLNLVTKDSTRQLVNQIMAETDRTPTPALTRATTKSEAGTDERNSQSVRLGSHRSPQSTSTQYTIMSKLKGVISQMVDYIEAHPSEAEGTADDFLALIDEANRSLKSAKVATRVAVRATAGTIKGKKADAVVASVAAAARQEAVAASVPREAAPVANVRPLTPPIATGTAAPKSYASILMQGTGRKEEGENHNVSAGEAAPEEPPPTPPAATPGDVNASIESILSEVSQPDPTTVRAMHDTPVAPRSIEERQAAAARNEERRLEAEERRRTMLQERQLKQELVTERVAQAKSRREEQQERLKTEVSERSERATRRADQAQEKRKEFATKDSQRVEEVAFETAASQDLKAVEIELRHRQAKENQEQLRAHSREEQRGRSEAYDAVLDRARTLSRQRKEQAAAKAATKSEQGRRHEEARKIEQEMKHQQLEERQARVQEHQAKVQEEERAKVRKAEQRIEQSAALRNEQREVMRQKLEQHDRKLKETRERKERGDEPKPATYHDVLATWVTEQEAAQQTTAVQTILNAGQRLARSFCENYASSQSSPAPPAPRSKFRAMLGRFSSRSCIAQARQPLHELLASLDSGMEPWLPGDHEHLRVQNGWSTLMACAIESRHCKPAMDLPTFKLSMDLMHRLLLHPTEGSQHTEYFVRAGHSLTVVAALREEIRLLKRHNSSIALKAFASLLQLSTAFCHSPAGDKPTSQSARDLLTDALLASDILHFAASVSSTCLNELDLASLQYTLIVVEHLVRFPKRGLWCAAAPGAEHRDETLRRLTLSLITLATGVAMPPQDRPSTATPPATSGDATVSSTAYASSRSVVSLTLFIVLRILNSIARVNLPHLQKIFSEVAPIAELSHMISTVCSYITANQDVLEKMTGGISSAELKATVTVNPSSLTTSFLDAVDFGLTSQELPRPTLSLNEGEPRSTRHGFLRLVLHELVLLSGYLALSHRPVQDMFAFGTTKTPLLLKLLATFPIAYFGLCKHIIMPTLLSICHLHEQNRAILSSEMDVGAAFRFLRDEAEARPKTMRFVAQKLLVTRDHASTSTPMLSPMPASTASVAWADLVDDDDDAFACLGAAPQEQRQSSASLANCDKASNDSFSSSQISALGKKMARQLQVNFFRVDRRFPVEIWPAAMEFFGTPESAAASGS